MPWVNSFSSCCVHKRRFFVLVEVSSDYPSSCSKTPVFHFHVTILLLLLFLYFLFYFFFFYRSYPLYMIPICQIFSL